MAKQELGCAVLYDICGHNAIIPSSLPGSTCVTAVQANHHCALLSVISWHGLLWQRNKPPWPMITPTANGHLCMGEAWLGSQITISPSVCANVCVCNIHAEFMTGFVIFVYMWVCVFVVFIYGWDFVQYVCKGAVSHMDFNTEQDFQTLGSRPRYSPKSKTSEKV